MNNKIFRFSSSKNKNNKIKIDKQKIKSSEHNNKNHNNTCDNIDTSSLTKIEIEQKDEKVTLQRRRHGENH